MAGNKLIDMAVTTSTFGAELITSANSAAARALLEVSSGGGGGEVASVNGQVGAVVLDYEDVGAASAAQGAKADTALQPGEAPGAITSVNGRTGIVVLTAADVGAATTTQGAKADTALQPGDIPSAPVSSVNGKTGAVTLVPSDIGAATSSQGAKADTAVQPGSLASVATSGSYNSLTNLPTLGTAASQSSSAFATAAQGAKADTAVQPASLTSGLATKQDLAGAWTNGALSGSWQPFGDTGFDVFQYRKVGDEVQVRGMVKLTGIPGTASVIANIPAGFRPLKRTILTLTSSYTSSGQTNTRVDLFPSGDIQFWTVLLPSQPTGDVQYIVLNFSYYTS